jgi:uncharacterized protein
MRESSACAREAESEHRIVLTRDHGLLKRRRVTHGLFVHAERPVAQAAEVVQRLDLANRLAPFTRCLRCGGELAPVDKADVLDRLEPLTRRHYHRFHRCRACGHIYWRGSHHARLAQVVEQVRAAANPT